jgi:hypothetical protein
VEAGATEEAFIASALQDVEVDGESELEAYERAIPLWQSYAGLKRYFEKRDSSCRDRRARARVCEGGLDR